MPISYAPAPPTTANLSDPTYLQRLLEAYAAPGQTSVAGTWPYSPGAQTSPLLAAMVGGVSPSAVPPSSYEPSLLKQLVADGDMPFADARQIELGKVTPDMTEFQYAVSTGAFKGNFVDWMKQKSASSSQGHFGDTVLSGRDAQGNLVPLRADPSGGLTQAQMPDGVTYDPGAIAGDKAGDVVDAKTAANARAALPGAEQGYEIATKAIHGNRCARH